MVQWAASCVHGERARSWSGWYAPAVGSARIAWARAVAWTWAVARAVARIGGGGQEVIEGNGTGDAPEQDAGGEEEQGGVEGNKWTGGGIGKDEEEPWFNFLIWPWLFQVQVSIWVVVGCKDAGGEEQGSENMQERAVHSRVYRKSLHCKSGVPRSVIGLAGCTVPWNLRDLNASGRSTVFMLLVTYCVQKWD